MDPSRWQKHSFSSSHDTPTENAQCTQKNNQMILYRECQIQDIKVVYYMQISRAALPALTFFVITFIMM